MLTYMPDKHPICALLIDLGISSMKSLRPYHPRVRDRDDVGALFCDKSGVIVLDSLEHVQDYYYASQETSSHFGVDDFQKPMNKGLEDLEFRVEQVLPVVTNKKWLDVGTGLGAIVGRLKLVATEVHAVEPQQEVLRNHLNAMGLKQIYSSIEDAPDDYYDVITLFHVFEHVPDPLAFLESARKKLVPGGQLICEVPHARDFLLSFLKLEAFKKFTLWSEHLILHTRGSLDAFLRAAGYSDIVIKGHQRYPLANHLYWLSKHQPDGHTVWGVLREKSLEKEYSALLDKLDMTDTLFAWAQK